MAQSTAAPVASGAPLGLSTLAVTTLILGLAFAGLIPGGLVVGLAVLFVPALLYGGIVGLLAGIWEFRAGSTLTGTIFTAYGGFWLSLALILNGLPGAGIAVTLLKAGVLPQVLGYFLLAWTIFTLLMFLASLKTNLALIVFFLLLLVTFILLTVNAFSGLLAGTGAAIFGVIGGYTAILTALVAFYTTGALILGWPVGARG